MKPEENTFNPDPTRNQVPVPPPSSHLVLAILTTIFCCLPLGIVSIVYASKVDSLYSVGDIAGATYNSLQARKWAYWGIGISLVGIVLYFLFAVCLGMANSLL